MFETINLREFTICHWDRSKKVEKNKIESMFPKNNVFGTCICPFGASYDLILLSPKYLKVFKRFGGAETQQKRKIRSQNFRFVFDLAVRSHKMEVIPKVT